MTVAGLRRWSVAAVVCALLLLAVWWHNDRADFPPGWDLRVYLAAWHSLKLGHDPYADATAIQREFHAHPHPGTSVVPFSYVYSPITLPFLAFLGRLPHAPVFALYWLLYAGGIVAALYVGFWAAHRDERRWLQYILPTMIGLAGLLECNAVLSGNVAYILYGAVLLAALLGWKRDMWWPFYLAVLVASCVKAPLLYLLAVPVLSARGQVWKAALAGAIGVGLFVIQPHVWPALFQHYLDAVELQFSYNQDFGASPAGALADGVKDFISYKVVSAGFYIFTSIFFGALLLLLRKRYFAGRFSKRDWIPVAMVGAMLLNPRIMEYDVAAINVFMVLAAWRACRHLRSTKMRLAVAVGAWLIFNAIALSTWRPTECMALVTVFFAGAWDLWTRSGTDAAIERDIERPEAVPNSPPVAALGRSAPSPSAR